MYRNFTVSAKFGWFFSLRILAACTTVFQFSVSFVRLREAIPKLFPQKPYTADFFVCILNSFLLESFLLHSMLIELVYPLIYKYKRLRFAYSRYASCYSLYICTRAFCPRYGGKLLLTIKILELYPCWNHVSCIILKFIYFLVVNNNNEYLLHVVDNIIFGINVPDYPSRNVESKSLR